MNNFQLVYVNEFLFNFYFLVSCEKIVDYGFENLACSIRTLTYLKDFKLDLCIYYKIKLIFKINLI